MTPVMVDEASSMVMSPCSGVSWAVERRTPVRGRGFGRAYQEVGVYCSIRSSGRMRAAVVTRVASAQK